MIDKIKRQQQFNNQEMQIPRNIQELMQRYDLDNKDIRDYLDFLITQVAYQENVNDIESVVNENADAINTINTKVNENAEEIDIRKHMVALELSSQFVLSQTGVGEIIPFSNVVSSYGNSLEVLNNGQIKIKNGKHLVKVSGQLCFTAGALNGKELAVCVNTTKLATKQVFSTYNYDFFVMPERPLILNEGDLLYVQLMGNAGDTIENWSDKTYLNVEVLS